MKHVLFLTHKEYEVLMYLVSNELHSSELEEKWVVSFDEVDNLRYAATTHHVVHLAENDVMQCHITETTTRETSMTITGKD